MLFPPPARGNSLSPSWFSLLRRPLVAYATLLLIILLFLFGLSSKHHQSPQVPYSHTHGGSRFVKAWDWRQDAHNYRLDEQECEVAFPGLFQEIDRAVRDRKWNRITVQEVDAIPPINGYVRGMIYEQQLYIISTHGGIYSRELATLHALHRAIVTSPEPLPNIEFTFISDDKIPAEATWTLARRPEDTATWLMPDFGFWAWPETKVGSYNEVQIKARLAESPSETPGGRGFEWSNKKPQLVWRGAAMGLELRQQFIDSTKDKPWADVKELEWHNSESMQNDLLSMSDHCQYKFLAHTEGNSYSGRLKFLQNCQSVIVAHKMDWLQHYTPLMRSSGEHQNFVEVNRNFSDLEATIQWLLANDNKARAIATENIRTFREKYLTPAAEACYWRKLIRGWRSVSFEPEFLTQGNATAGEESKWRGVPWESFALERRLEWDPY